MIKATLTIVSDMYKWLSSSDDVRVEEVPGNWYLEHLILIIKYRKYHMNICILSKKSSV